MVSDKQGIGLVLGWVAALVLVLIVSASAIGGGVGELDDGEFIAGLARFGQWGLINEIVGGAEGCGLTKQAEMLGGLTEGYLAVVDDERFDEAFELTRSFYRAFIDCAVTEGDGRVGRWREGYVRSLLFGALAGRKRADLFLLFGVPSYAMREQGGKLIEEASAVMGAIEGIGERVGDDNDELMSLCGWCDIYMSRVSGTELAGGDELVAELVERDGCGVGLGDDWMTVARELVRARGLYSGGNGDEAFGVVEALRGVRGSGVRGSGLCQILLTDFQVLMIRDYVAAMVSENEKRLVMAEAYELYDRLLADERVGERRGEIAEFIGRRYVESGWPIDDVGVMELPCVFVLADAMAKCERGEELLAMDREGAIRVLGEAVDLFDNVYGRNGLTGDEAARIGFYTARVRGLMGEGERAIEGYLAVGKNYCESKFGEVGITNAVLLAGEEYVDGKGRIDDVVERYMRTIEVLFEKYPTLELADEMRYWYAALLRDEGRYDEAVNAYENIGRKHRHYVESLYERLVCVEVLWSEARDEGKRDLGAKVLKARDDFVKEADRMMYMAIDDARRGRLARYQGFADVIKCQVLIELEGRAGEAVNLANDIVERFADIDEVAARGMGLEVWGFYKLGRYDEAARALIDMRGLYSDRADALVPIVLEGLLDEARAVERAGRVEDSRKLGHFVDELMLWLSDLLRTREGMDEEVGDGEEEGKIKIVVAYRLILARGYQRMREYEAAINEYSKLLEAAGSDIDVIAGLAESSFQVGDDERASELFGEIIRYAMNGELEKGYEYWHAQMRSYEIWDRQSEGCNSRIFGRISALELADKELGGEPFCGVLRGLKEKHGAY